MSRVLGMILALAALVASAPAAEAKRAALTRFGDCQALGTYARAHARSYRTMGRPVDIMPVAGAPVGAPGPAGGEGTGTTGAPAVDGSSGESFSTTNVQEAGVFEPDIVKTDGKLVYTITSTGTFVVVNATGAPKTLGTLKLDEQYGYNHQLLLDGRADLVLAMWSASDPDTGYDVSTLALIDVSDPTAPVIERQVRLDGSIVSARRTDRTVRAVMALRPPALTKPVEDRAEAPGRAWLPRGRFESAAGKTSSRRLVGCRSVRRPRSFSGLEQLTVLTINLDRGLNPVDSDAVMTGGETVYASTDNLYVATQRYRPGLEARTNGEVPDEVTTLIHRFSLDDADNTTYRGSGVVPGFALSQFSLSEFDGVLRVATTSVPTWFDGGSTSSESFVTTLEPSDGALEQIGQLDGIGKDERIYAVRFLGDTGYVVTFQQTDPLFTIDLSDPTKPRVLGELVIPGFSSYLHPISGNRLIGIGTGPDDEAGTFGLQVSLFDVSDLAHPKLERRVTFNNGSSEVAYDHHAFLWWAPRDLAVLPVDAYGNATAGACPPDAACIEPAYDFRSEAVGLTVRPSGIAEVGRVDHGGAQVRRSLVNGDRLLTVSDAGVKVSSLDDFTEIGFAKFPAAATGNTNPSPGGGVVEASPPSP